MTAAADTLALSTELARLREYVHKGEREALLADVDVLRAELLRAAEALERMQALPQVSRLQAFPEPRRSHLVSMTLLTFPVLRVQYLVACSWP